ncbi:MAG: DNA-binding response regulator [Candidatus Methylomirabilota bacterium]|nr:MAG: DNA-binding response regulator [candidate division NC10 bacterium]
MTISLVLADEHPIVLDGLMQLFRVEPDIEVVACCATGMDALESVRTHRPDVLSLGLCMPGMDGLAVLREMNKAKLPTRAVLFTSAINEDQAINAIRLGVCGVVLKEMAPSLLVQCVRKVHAGEQWLEKRSFGRVLDTLLQREAAHRKVAGILTLREIEIVRMVASGQRNKAIADRLVISEGTVKSHLHNIYDKLDLGNRVALCLYAQQKGLV